VTSEERASGPLDVTTLNVLAERAHTHRLVETWALRPDAMSPRHLELSLDDGQYPPLVTEARLDIRWFVGGDYTFHYLETRTGDIWQCRWDRHPKPGEPNAHFHPPPDANPDVDPSKIQATHHLGVLFAVLDWVDNRLKQLHD